MCDRAILLDLLRLFAPAALSNLSDWLRPLIFNLFVSRNIKNSRLAVAEAALELDAVGLSVMSLNLLLFATAYGFNGAVDSYASIAFGMRDYRSLHALLLRQVLLLALLGILALTLLVSAETIFLRIGVDADLAARSAALLWLMGLAVPGDFLYDAISRWMRGQQLHGQVATCSCVALTLNLAVNLCLASQDEPTRAPVLALVAQNNFLPVLLIAAYLYSGVYCSKDGTDGGKSRWPSFQSCSSCICVPAMWDQLRTGIAAMVWTCAEVWAWEVQVFEAQALGSGNAAAYTLLSSTFSLLICVFPVSVGSAASALIGEALGQGNVAHATRVLTTACILAMLLVAGYALLLTAQRTALARLLGGGVKLVTARYEEVLPLVLSMHLLDGLFNILKAWLTVRKQQAFGAGMTLFIYYGCGVPLGLWLAFPQRWGLIGLWTGLGLAVLLGCIGAGVQTTRDVGRALAISSESFEYRRFEDRSAELDKPNRRHLLLPFLLLPGVAACVAVLVWRAPWHHNLAGT
mmetsp:Transcript_57759/g.95467  ORF Transcript_57759/g.95467 Transcript_57759/m.95467 type:complete len:519 (+) Transcript_57759:24-1580(+)